MKKTIEQVGEVKNWTGGADASVKKLEEEIERQIALKKTETFNENIVEMM